MSAGFLAGCYVSWFSGWLLCQLAVRLVVMLAGFLAACYVSWLSGWLAGWFLYQLAF